MFSYEVMLGNLRGELQQVQKSIVSLKKASMQAAGLQKNIEVQLEQALAFQNHLQEQIMRVEQDMMSQRSTGIISDYRDHRINELSGSEKELQDQIQLLRNQQSYSRWGERRKLKQIDKLNQRLNRLRNKSCVLKNKQRKSINRKYNRKRQVMASQSVFEGRIQGSANYNNNLINDLENRKLDIKNQSKYMNAGTKSNIVIGTRNFVSKARTNALDARIKMLRMKNCILQPNVRSFGSTQTQMLAVRTM